MDHQQGFLMAYSESPQNQNSKSSTSSDNLYNNLSANMPPIIMSFLGKKSYNVMTWYDNFSVYSQHLV